MSTIAATSRPGIKADGIVLTFVAGSCTLKCGGCPIVTMRELTKDIPGDILNELHLTGEDFVDFARSVNQQYHVGKVLMQGYEPLHPETLPYTKALMSWGRIANIPEVGFITNGQHWDQSFIEWCATNQIAITISLNSDDDAVHNPTRGFKAAEDVHEYSLFTDTDSVIKGIVTTYLQVNSPEVVQDLITITSILFTPRGAEHLVRLPEFVKEEYGLSNIVFNPYLHDNGTGILVPREVEQSLIALEQIRQAGEAVEVKVWGPAEMTAVIEPELREEFPNLEFHGDMQHLHTRLTSEGRLKVSGHGKGLFGIVDDQTPTWYPDRYDKHVPAHEMLATLRPDISFYARQQAA